MSSDILIPLEVMGLGIVISYGIAGMMQLTLICIRAFRKTWEKKVDAK
ncbi:MAG: hypothetical protein LKJ90_04650 [Faecalibacterium sp.]|jgi:hypothetical protein|nr:hypothetical protein [Faecalibacterium sp.]